WPVRGSLILAFANVRAYRTFDPAEPLASRFLDEDMNRLWSPDLLDRPVRSVERERARALRPFLDASDLLLDLHSMQHPTEPLALAGTLAQGRDLARRLGFPKTVVVDAGHVAGPRMRDYGAFAVSGSGRASMLLEAGQHWARATVDVMMEAALRFL